MGEKEVSEIVTCYREKYGARIDSVVGSVFQEIAAAGDGDSLALFSEHLRQAQNIIAAQIAGGDWVIRADRPTIN